MSMFARSAIYLGTIVLLVVAVAVPLMAVPAPLACPVENPTIVGTPHADELTGTPGDDIVSLGAGDDRFAGEGGDDVVCGGPGSDDLSGGDGDDRLFGEEHDDAVRGWFGNDYVDGGSGADQLWDDTMGPSEVRDDTTGLTIPGGDGADHLFGGEGNDELQLSAGDGLGGGRPDEADGGAGRDSVGYFASPVGVNIDAAGGTATGEAVDRLVAVEGPYVGTDHADTLVGTSGDDVLQAGWSGGPTEDVVRGLAGDDVLTADSGVVEAGPGNDVVDSEDEYYLDMTVDLGDGDDKMTLWKGRPLVVRGGPGNDTVVVQEPHDTSGTQAELDGGRGEDRVEFLLWRPVHVDLAAGEVTFFKSRLVLRHIDEIVGSFKGDTLLGSAEDDVLHGRDGDDVLRGREGPDHLVGDSGNDVAYGDLGTDTCEAEHRFSC